MAMSDEALYAAMKAKGHSPKLDEAGEIDLFVYYDYDNMHNGPGCFRCGWSCSQHSVYETDIPQCTEVETSIEFIEDTGAGYMWTATAKDKKYHLALNGPNWILYDQELNQVASDEDIDELQQKIGFTIVLKSAE